MLFLSEKSRVSHPCCRKKKMSQPSPIPTKDGLMNIFLPIYRKCALRGYFPGRGNCRGCGKEFKKYECTWEPAYFIHCINECEEYKKLGLFLADHLWNLINLSYLDRISKCEECKLVFVDKPVLGAHKKIHRRTTRLAMSC